MSVNDNILGFVESAFCSGLLKILKCHGLLRETSSSLHKFQSSGRLTALYTSPYLGLGGLRVDGIGLRPLMAFSLSGPRKPVCTLTQRGYVCLGTVSRLDAWLGTALSFSLENLCRLSIFWFSVRLVYHTHRWIFEVKQSLNERISLI